MPPRWWPFGGSPPPSSADATDTLVRALQRLASARTPDADPSLCSAVATAGTLYGAALAQVTIADAPDYAARALTPAVLAEIGRAYPRAGRAALIVQVDGSGLTLIPCAAVRREDGRYDTTRLEGGLTIERLVRADELVLIEWEPTAPWTRAAHAAQALANLERATATEGRLPVGQLLSVAGDSSGEAGDAQDDTLIRTLNEAAGELVRLPAQSDRGLLAPPDVSLPPARREGMLTRLGPEFGQSGVYDRLHAQLVAAVLPALGVPPVLASGTAASTALREARRHFIGFAVGPVLAHVVTVLRERLDAPQLQLTVGDAERVDVQARARAAATLAGAGVDVDDALRIAGIEIPE